MHSPLRILCLVGSPTDDFHRELSELYAKDCLEALARDKRFSFHVAHVSPDGAWRLAASFSNLNDQPTLTISRAIAAIDDLDFDLALPQMFCLNGMTTYRNILDLIDLPYIGNSALVMGLTADKWLTRAIVSAADVTVPKGELVPEGSSPTLTTPTVVKPALTDNSKGVSLVNRAEDYESALELAHGHGGSAIVERYIPLGREVRCGVIVQEGRLLCLPLEEYTVSNGSRPIRRAEHKLHRDDGGKLSLAAKTETEAWIVGDKDPIVQAVHHEARKCFHALGCKQYGLFDFRIDPDDKPFFLEAGLYCSFSPKSVIVTMGEAAGIPLAELLTALALDTISARPKPDSLTSKELPYERTNLRPARSSRNPDWSHQRERID